MWTDQLDYISGISGIFLNLKRVFILSILIGFLAALFILNREFIIGTDYKSFLTGAKLVTSNPSRLYDLDFQYKVQKQLFPSSDKFLPFKGSPVTAYLYSPLLFFEVKWSFVLFALLNIALLFLFIKIFNEKLLRHWNNKSAILYSLLFLPNYISIFNGQISILLLLIYMFIFISLKDKSSTKTGLLSGLLIIKPQYLISVPFLLFLSGEKHKYIKGFFFSLSVLILASIFFTHGGYIEYLYFLLKTEVPSLGSDMRIMMSISSILIRFFEAKFTYIINLLLYLIFLFVFIKKKTDISIDQLYSVMILLSLAMAVHVWDHDFVLLQIPTFLLLPPIRKVNIAWLFALLITPFLILSLKVGYLSSVSFILLSVYLLNFQNDDLWEVEQKPHPQN